MFDSEINHFGNDKNTNDSDNSIKKKVRFQGPKFENKSNTLDEGVMAFGEWIASKDDPQKTCGQLSLTKFEENERIFIFDNTRGKEVCVEIADGVPECKTCTDSDCMHIGFSICVMQIYRRNGIVNLT
jgi:hypothetical protein